MTAHVCAMVEMTLCSLMVMDPSGTLGAVPIVGSHVMGHSVLELRRPWGFEAEPDDP